VSVALWILAGLAAWCALAVVAGLVVGAKAAKAAKAATAATALVALVLHGRGCGPADPRQFTRPAARARRPEPHQALCGSLDNADTSVVGGLVVPAG
jgi:hypothetical protein